MNSKRWIAVGLSIVVFFSSLVVSFVGRILTQDAEKTSFGKSL